MPISGCMLRNAGFALFLAHAVSVAAPAASEREMSRGELLYSTHCIACHTVQVHWRQQRLAQDWPSLEHQVRRWQDNARLQWDEEDVAAVTQYLNSLYYHFPPTNGKRKAFLSGSQRSASLGRIDGDRNSASRRRSNPATEKEVDHVPVER